MLGSAGKLRMELYFIQPMLTLKPGFEFLRILARMSDFPEWPRNFDAMFCIARWQQPHFLTLMRPKFTDLD